MPATFHQPYNGKKISFVNSWAKLKHGMTAETANSLAKADRAPREGTREGRRYDERRACEYMRVITGKTIRKAEWSGDRIRWVVTASGESIEIPNWNFTPIAAEHALDVFA